ncbi:pseudouridine synthase [Hymenobacter sp. HMF4947]|uniref:Pseudouridine synthase n=1 Tax=Hymenobacter ginkgonis TaxID=2682976 RepID=A0A7K1TAB2_9BACT|nr:pseudouridine synthase [Hymenobacter ginkgonis]MVN75329.1 pseudouridine synthase [Hymenobacter ginkgonis]
MRYVLLNKPYEVLTQFTDEHGRATLKDFVNVPDVYPVGRLDFDSEGLLLLTDDKQLQHRLSDPRYKVPKTYWAQVEGTPTAEALEKLRQGVQIKEGFTLPATAQVLPDDVVADLWPRTPPIRYRASIPTSWLEITISQGMNRQVRKMCAAVGLPCLRLVRQAIGDLPLYDLQPGTWRELTEEEAQALRGLAGAGSRPALPYRRPTPATPAAGQSGFRRKPRP